MSNNNDNSGVGMAVVLVVVVIYVMAIMLYFALVFLAFMVTIACAFAWNNPLTIGRWTLWPEEARSFVYRGLGGAVLLPAFVVFLAVFFNIQINDEFAVHIILGGYAFGSVGLEILWAEEGQKPEPRQTVIPPHQQLAPPQDDTPPRAPFRFASWDDEDGK